MARRWVLVSESVSGLASALESELELELGLESVSVFRQVASESVPRSGESRRC